MIFVTIVVVVFPFGIRLPYGIYFVHLHPQLANNKRERERERERKRLSLLFFTIAAGVWLQQWIVIVALFVYFENCRPKDRRRKKEMRVEGKTMSEQPVDAPIRSINDHHQQKTEDRW